jgi:hypothetical protein
MKDSPAERAGAISCNAASDADERTYEHWRFLMQKDDRPVSSMSLDQRLDLAKVALADAEGNAGDLTKNTLYWKNQVERERRLVESLVAEMREANAKSA